MIFQRIASGVSKHNNLRGHTPPLPIAQMMATQYTTKEEVAALGETEYGICYNCLRIILTHSPKQSGVR